MGIHVHWVSRFCIRGFDIGNHFCEWMYDYNHDKPPFFKVNTKNYPTKAQQVHNIPLSIFYLRFHNGKHQTKLPCSPQLHFCGHYLSEIDKGFENLSCVDQLKVKEKMMVEINR